jgi:hypothetical protein
VNVALDGGETLSGCAVRPEEGVNFEAALHPFYEIPRGWTYRMYFDRASEPYPFY